MPVGSVAALKQVIPGGLLSIYAPFGFQPGGASSTPVPVNPGATVAIVSKIKEPRNFNSK